MTPTGLMEGANEIVETLLQDQRFEAFHNHIQSTRGLLYDGTLLNIREVEALLTAKNHVRHLLTEKGVLPELY